MLKRTLIVDDITPEELAAEWCGMGYGQQALFFNEVANIIKKWDKDFCFQLQYLMDEGVLTDEGRRVMELIGNYSSKT